MSSQFANGTDDRDNVTVAIEGIADPAVAADVQKRIRMVCRAAASRRPLIVAIAPSDTRGRWDLGVKTGTGRHVASFSAPLDRVADVVADHLRRILARLD